MNTIRSCLVWAEEILKGNNIETAKLDAEVILSYILGCERVELHLNKKEKISKGKLKFFISLIERRSKKEPVAYILGWKEFWSRKVIVNSDVLIPRPETEGMIEFAIKFFDRSEKIKILDLCTGSGCVAVALAGEFPNADITAADISEAALNIARKNLSFAKGRVNFSKSDLFEGVAEKRFDLITANPPYISTVDMLKLPEGIRLYEPEIALHGGNDGLDFSKRIIFEAHNYLSEEGVLIMEVGIGQSRILIQYTHSVGRYKRIEALKDYFGIDRFVTIKR